MTETPASLLQRLRSPGQLAAWDEFVELYLPILYCWTRRLRLQEADANDLVQDVFAVLVRKLPEFEYDRTLRFRGWLRTILLNRWREVLRKQKAGPHCTGDAELETLDAADEEPPFWEAEHRRLLVLRLLELVRPEFQPATWQACWECVGEGRSAGDVGAKLQLSAGAVRAAKFRVLARLRAEADGLLD